MFGTFPYDVSSLTKNTFTTFAEQLTGLKFSFETVAVGDTVTKQGILLASGDYPDVMWSAQLSAADVLKYGSEHVFQPPQGLIKQYAPNLWHNIQTVPGYKEAVTAPNGDIYALPVYNYCPHCSYTYQDYINAGLLEKFGLSLPRTTAQFAKVLDVFKKHGITPLSGAIDAYDADPIQFIMNAFIPFDGDLTTGENDVNVNGNGQVVFAPVQPGWKAGLEYLNSLYNNGDFSASVFTQQPTVPESLIDSNEVGVIPDGAIQTINPKYGEPGSHWLDWVALPPLTGPTGGNWAAFAGVGFPTWYATAITNKASKTQAIGIMKLVNYMNTTTGSLNYNSGSYWVPAPKGATGLVPGQAIYTMKNPNVDFVQPNWLQNTSWYQFGPFYTSYAARMLEVSPPPFVVSGAQTLDQLWTEVGPLGHQAVLQYPTNVFVPLEDATAFDTEQTNIDNWVDSWTEEFVTGAKSVTNDWSSYISGLKALGLASYMKTLQQVSHPINTNVALYHRNQANLKFLICKGPVPSLVKMKRPG
jgi:putative aldouronate transport system substrate-binding protein